MVSMTEQKRDELEARAIAALELSSTRYSELTALTRGLLVNDAILVERVTLNAQGLAEVSSTAPAASIVVSNFGTLTVTVYQGGGANAPGDGLGLFDVGPGELVALPLAGHVWSFYGRPGERIGVALFSRPVAPTAGQCATAPFYSVTLNSVAPSSFALYTAPNGRTAIYGGLVGQAGAGGATIVITDTVAGGTVLDQINLAANAYVSTPLGAGVAATSPVLWVNVSAGSFVGAVRVR